MKATSFSLYLKFFLRRAQEKAVLMAIAEGGREMDGKQAKTSSQSSIRTDHDRKPRKQKKKDQDEFEVRIREGTAV